MLKLLDDTTTMGMPRLMCLSGMGPHDIRGLSQSAVTAIWVAGDDGLVQEQIQTSVELMIMENAGPGALEVALDLCCLSGLLKKDADTIGTYTCIV